MSLEQTLEKLAAKNSDKKSGYFSPISNKSGALAGGGGAAAGFLMGATSAARRLRDMLNKDFPDQPTTTARELGHLLRKNKLRIPAMVALGAGGGALIAAAHRRLTKKRKR